MPVRDKEGRGGWDEDMSLYAQLWEYAITVMAIDHFFNEAVEGNVPLESAVGNWWERRIVAERVNRYSEPWCLLYEGLSAIRERIESQVPYSNVQIDQNLKAVYHNGRRGYDAELRWAKEDRD